MINHPFIENVMANLKAGKSCWTAAADAFNASLSPLTTSSERRSALSTIEAELDETIFPPGSIPVVSAIIRQLRTLQSETELLQHSNERISND